jgi:hypothetical protein
MTISHRGRSRRASLLVASCGAIALVLTSGLEAVAAPSVRWTRQLGTVEQDSASAVAVDRVGRSVIVGRTQGEFPGQIAGGGDSDGFVRKHSPGGTHLWTRQFGSAAADEANGVATDGDGNVYVAGGTEGDLRGPNTGGEDAFVRSYTSAGKLRWTRQFGTTEDDEARAIAVDRRGNVYVVGQTDGDLATTNEGDRDAFIRKYSSTGVLRWTRQFGVFLRMGVFGVTVDRYGDVIVVGETEGVLAGSGSGNWDAWVRKYAADGRVRWTRQFGTPGSDGAEGVASDRSGNVVLVGSTGGEFPGQTLRGSGDAFVRKLSRSGKELWTRQFGSADSDFGTSIDTDRSGNVYVGGNAYGQLPGQDEVGEGDAFVRRYGGDGRRSWTRQFGTASQDGTNGVGVDGSGRVYLAGYSFGDLAGRIGSVDAFLRSYGP